MSFGPIGRRFPRSVINAWKLSDPSTGQQRPCDALKRDTYQQRFTTLRGDYWICSETGQMARAEWIEEPSDTYDEYWQRHIDAAPPAEETRRKHAVQLEKVRCLERFRQTGRLFEVGAGLGTLLRAAGELGWRAEGNELSARAARHAETISQSRVLSGPIEQVKLEPGVYDVVLMDNVFEHLQEPREVLQNLAASLRPGGVMYLNTLNAQSLSLWWNPRDWYYFVERHYFIPTRVSLAQYFADAGLAVVSCQTHGFCSGKSDKVGHYSTHRRSWWEKPLSSVAAQFDLGHRIEFVIQQVGRTALDRQAEHRLVQRAA